MVIQLGLHWVPYISVHLFSKASSLPLKASLLKCSFTRWSFERILPLNRLLWILWGFNYFSSWVVELSAISGPRTAKSLWDFLVGVYHITTLGMSGISLGKPFANAMSVLFLAIIWQRCSFSFCSEIFENHFFFSFSPRIVASSLGVRSTANKQTSKKCSWYFFT